MATERGSEGRRGITNEEVLERLSGMVLPNLTKKYSNSDPEMLIRFEKERRAESEFYIAMLLGTRKEAFREIPANRLKEAATILEFAPVGKTEHGRKLAGYLLGRADVLEEAPNFTASQIVEMS